MDDYNGWTNRETWAVNLWVMNDEPTYRLSQTADLSTPGLCKEFVIEVINVAILNSILRDISPKKLDNVNWHEICEAWNET